MLIYEQQQPRRRRPTDPHAPNAAPSGNPAGVVVAVAEVLGSEIVAVLVTKNFVTRGPKACYLATHGCS